jgi:hypothetical protein
MGVLLGMTRVELLIAAKFACSNLQRRYPNDHALASVIAQIDYLIDLQEGRRDDAQRLSDIIIAVLTTREIEQLDQNTAELLYDVCAEIAVMKQEWSAKGYNVGKRIGNGDRHSFEW